MRRNSVSTHSAPASAVRGDTRGGLDSFDYIDGLPGLIDHVRPTVVPRGAPVAVIGWAVDPDDRPVSVVNLIVDGVRVYGAQSGIARGDVAEREEVDEFVGFRAVVPTDDLAPGAHEVRAYAAVGGAWFEAARIDFFIYDPTATAGPPANRPIRIVIDRVGPLGNERSQRGDAVPSGATLQISGWGYDALAGRGAALVTATAGDRVWAAPCIVERPDVASMLGVSARALGFELLIPTASLERGAHRIDIVGYDAAGGRFANSHEIRVRVAGEIRRFPLVARERAVAAHAAAAYHLHGDEPGAWRHLPPTVGVLEVKRTAKLCIAGWALTADGEAAASVFVEIAHAGVPVPPTRVAAIAGFTATATQRPAVTAPRADCAFTVEIDTAQLRERDYAVDLLVVEPDRRSVARLALGTLRILAPRRSGRGAGRYASRRRE